jgi:voltage-gated potassium channel
MMLAREDEIARETMRELIDAMHDHYIICGYGRMGQQIASDLRQESVPFVVVEDNPEQIPRLKAENIPHVIGNASGDDTLQQAGIMRAKGLVAVTATDEENVFIVLTARGMNPGLYIVARSIREENEGKLRRAGANRVMSPYILGGRRMSAAIIKPGVMDFLDLLVHRDGIETDVVCLPVPPASPAVGRTLEHLGLWQACGVTVLAVQHDTEVLANPCPDYVVAEGDSLIMMGTPDQLAGAERFLRHV